MDKLIYTEDEKFELSDEVANKLMEESVLECAEIKNPVLNKFLTNSLFIEKVKTLEMEHWMKNHIQVHGGNVNDQDE